MSFRAGARTREFACRWLALGRAGVLALFLAAPAAAVCPGGWQQLSSIGPGNRIGFGLAYDSARDRVVLFGGTTGNDELGDTWEWNGTAWALVATSGPAPRWGASMTYDPVNGRVLLFGGTTGGDETWAWNGTTWVELATTGPSARVRAGFCYDVARSRAVLFGGGPADTWEWDGASWSLMSTSGPSGAGVAAMAYDAARARTVLVNDVNATTWTWNGTAWSQAAASGPVPRMGASIAYDAARGQVVMVGGRHGNAVLSNETWVWDGTAWSQAGSAGAGAPNPAFDGKMVYDSARQRCVQFGGNFGYQTWAWTGSTATITQQPGGMTTTLGQPASFSVAAATSGPGPLTYQWRHFGAPLANGGNVSGANSATLTLSSVTLQDGGDYDVVVADGCASVTSQTATLCAAPFITTHPLTQLGFDGDPLTLSVAASSCVTATYQWRRNGANLSDGGAYSGATSATLTINPLSAVHAGSFDCVVSNPTGTVTSAAAAITVSPCASTASSLSTSGPTGATWNGIPYDISRDRVVMFASGVDEMGPGETWEFDGSSWSQVSTEGPVYPTGPALAYDSQRQVTMMFGGREPDDFNTESDKTYEWNGTFWILRFVSGPPARHHASLAYDPVRHRMVLFGGATGQFSSRSLFKGDTWEFDGTAWSLRASTGPSPRAGAMMSYDAARGRMVLFGGGTSTTSYQDTWEWDGTTWNQRASTGPPPRSLAAMAFDPLRARMVLFGGFERYVGGAALGDTWDWDGATATWTRTSLGGSPPQPSVGMCWDAARNRMLLRGTINLTTWLMQSASPSITAQPIAVNAAVGGSAQFAVTATGKGTLEYRWSRNGTTVLNGPNVSGATTPMLTLNNIAGTDQGGYDVTVTGNCGVAKSARVNLNVLCAPARAIQVQPVDLTEVLFGQPASFSVTAVGCTPVTYQWRFNNVAIPGATAATYNIASITTSDVGSYSVAVTDQLGTTVSRLATLNSPGPVFVSFTATVLSGTQVRIDWSSQQSASAQVEYGGTNVLGTLTPPTAQVSGGSITIDRGSRTRFFYKIVLTDALNRTATTSPAEVVFPASGAVVTGNAIATPGAVNLNGPGTGVQVGVKVTNSGTEATNGPVIIENAKLNGAPPRTAGGAVALPVTVVSSLASGTNARTLPDLIFSRAEVGGSSGTLVTFTATVRWYESPGTGGVSHTFTITQKVKLP